MTTILAALVLTNLAYVAGAVVVATLISSLYVLLHRKPKSLESGIESFSRELRALAPEQGGEVDPPAPPGQPGVRAVPGQPAPSWGAARAPRKAPPTVGHRAFVPAAGASGDRRGVPGEGTPRDGDGGFGRSGGSPG